MSRSGGQFNELSQLAAALCDGEITPAQAARLEGLATTSDVARQYFHEYVLLHGELYWEHAAGHVRPVPVGRFGDYVRRHKRRAIRHDLCVRVAERGAVE